MIAFSILSEDVKQIQVWKPRKKDRLFAASQILVFLKTCIFAHFYFIFLKENIDLLFMKSRPLTWY